jgi:chemotaxis regulatin CheY-phosphate phosphatase CheZ
VRQTGRRSVSEEITALVNTLRELAAIRSTAEDAANRILDSAEGLLAAADKDEAKKAQDAILSIMMACGFHDLVGQRVTKITETLDRVIAKRLNGNVDLAAYGARARKVKAKGPKLSGPALPGEPHAQARIDALLKTN